MDYRIYILIAVIAFIIIALAIASSAGANFYDVFQKYNKIFNSRNMTSQEFLFFALQRMGFYNIRIFRTHGELTDAYMYRQNCILISDSCFDNPSVSALAVVSHELGHAIQHKNSPKLFSFLQFLKIFNKLLSWLVIPLLIAGLFILFVFPEITHIGTILFIIGLALAFVTLFYRILSIKIEYDASKIAIDFLKEYKFLSAKEIKYAKKVMKSAAMTYVATFFAEMLYWTMLIKKPKS